MDSVASVQMKKKLVAEIVTWIFSIYFVIAFSTTCIQLYAEFMHEKQRLGDEVAQLFQNFSDVLSAAVWSMDESYLQATVDGMLKNGIVNQVVVLDQNEEPVLIRETTLAASEFFSAVSKYHFPLIYAEDGIVQSLGEVQLYAPQSIVFERAKHTLLLTLTNAIVKTAFLWLITWWVLNKWVARPLLELTSSVRDYMQGGSTRCAHASGRLSNLAVREDELGQLTRDYLQLEQQIEINKEALDKYQNHLQQLVVQRTSQLEQTIKHLDVASRVKNEFLSNISHEIRTPMNAINIAAQLLSNSSLSVEQSETIELIKQSCQNLLSVVNDILDFSKMESEQFALEQNSFDLASMLMDIQNNLLAQAQDKSLYLNVDYANDCPYQFIGDKKRIQQIISNLVHNGIKFTEKGGVTIQVMHSYQQDVFWLTIKVIDTGTGIGKEKQQIIFNAFTQGDGAFSRRYGGTGLGLAISKRLTLLMKGDLLIEGSSEQGTTFILRLPLQPIDVTLTPISSSSVVSPQPSHSSVLFHNLRILYAEDNHINQVLGEQLLRSLGIDVVLAGNGVEAVEAVKKCAFDLVLMDLQMPEMDGLEATRTIRALSAPLCKIPIIALTANEDDGVRETCVAVGMNGFVAKPFELQMLVDEIRRCLPNSGMIN